MEAGPDCGAIPAPELHRSLRAGHLESDLEVYVERWSSMGTVFLALRSSSRIRSVQQEVVRPGASKHRVYERPGGHSLPWRSCSSRYRQLRTCGGLDALRTARRAGMGSEGQRHDRRTGCVRSLL